MTTSLNIAIAGCGIGGLAAAVFLRRAGHSVTLYDQFAAPAPVGSGLVVQPVGQEVLAHLGVLPAAVCKGAPIYQMIGHEARSGREVLNVHYGPQNGESFGLGIHRASLFGCLLEAAQSEGLRVHVSHDIMGTALKHTGTKTGGRTLSFTNGETSPAFDLVIDTTGAGSPLSPLRARPTTYGAIWGTVDWPETSPLPRDKLSQRYRRASHMMGVLPIGTLPDNDAPKAAIFWSLPQDRYEAWRAAPLAAWKAEAMALWPEFAPFLSGITDHDQMTMARYSHGTLRRPYSERLVHIGDAAHRASPQLGQGANMALLDAYALSVALAKCAPAKCELEDALKAYHHSRRLHTGIYQAMSWAFTPMYQSSSRVLPFMRDYITAPMGTLPVVSSGLTALVKGTMCAPVREFDV